MATTTKKTSLVLTLRDMATETIIQQLKQAGMEVVVWNQGVNLVGVRLPTEKYMEIESKGVDSWERETGVPLEEMRLSGSFTTLSRCGPPLIYSLDASVLFVSGNVLPCPPVFEVLCKMSELSPQTADKDMRQIHALTVAKKLKAVMSTDTPSTDTLKV